MGYIQGVPEVLQISDFMSNSKCPELARRFADQVPQTVTEIMKRVDDFFKSEEAFKSIELPKGEQSKKGHGMDWRYENWRFEHRMQEVNQLSLGSLVKRPKEILATELQLQLPPPTPLVKTRKKENIDIYCEYHGEKRHYANDCFQLKRQLEIALEFEKLNHPVKDVRQQRGNRGRQGGNGSTHGKIINMGVHRSASSGASHVRALFLKLVPSHPGPPKLNSHKIVVEASSPYNIILGRTEIRELHVVSSTTHAMMKFPTPRGIATLVPRRDAIFECRHIERRVCLATTGRGWHSKTDQPACPECKSKRYPGSTKAEDAGPGKKQSSGEGSGGMAQSGDSKAGTVPHMDIKSGPSKKAFQTQLGRNLEAYVDDIVIKSRTEKDMIMDVMEMFDNLKKINMKLNPKKCSFGVKEGKLLGYMVTSEGIRSNPKKTKAVADMQSPKTLKEMQSLSGKLAALNRFLSGSAERTMPFFDTLKNIMKENKDDFHWTKAAEQAFQELKTLIIELPTLTTPNLKETLYVYLAAFKEVVSGVLMADRRGKRTPIRYVCQTLHDTQQTKGIRKASRELGAYNIAYMPRNVINGQVLADLLNEVSVGTRNLEVFSLSNNTKVEEWTLFTDGASSLKGAGAGLVLIDPTGTEYTYAIRLNFTRTNNEAEFGFPRVIMTDNETQLVNDPFKSWCEKWKIKKINKTVAYPQANGLVERANKSLMHGLKAWLGRENVRWVDEFLNILLAHRTMLKTSNGETAFSLTYGSEAVNPAEIGMPTYRTIQWNEALNEEEIRLNLDLIQ
nr:reverse transcriptase domain-containing protein [Tanacetum cinerariifolium]